MKRIRASIFGFCALLLTSTAHAESPALTPAQTDAIRALVRQTLIENPEILTDALEVLKTKHAAAQQDAQRAAIVAQKNNLIHADDPFMGPKQASVTAIEFFDYNCGYCRMALADVLAVIKDNPKARIVMKDLPVLGPDSEAVSRLALASRNQGRYVAFHTALMQHKGRLTAETALETAKSLKLDVERLKRDAEAQTITDTLARNHALASALGIQGTPSFVVGETLFPGRVDAGILSAALKDLQNSKP